MYKATFSRQLGNTWATLHPHTIPHQLQAPAKQPQFSDIAEEFRANIALLRAWGNLSCQRKKYHLRATSKYKLFYFKTTTTHSLKWLYPDVVCGLSRGERRWAAGLAKETTSLLRLNVVWCLPHKIVNRGRGRKKRQGARGRETLPAENGTYGFQCQDWTFPRKARHSRFLPHAWGGPDNTRW